MICKDPFLLVISGGLVWNEYAMPRVWRVPYETAMGARPTAMPPSDETSLKGESVARIAPWPPLHRHDLGDSHFSALPLSGRDLACR